MLRDCGAAPAAGPLRAGLSVRPELSALTREPGGRKTVAHGVSRVDSKQLNSRAPVRGVRAGRKAARIFSSVRT